jgi:restriction system protein
VRILKVSPIKKTEYKVESIITLLGQGRADKGLFITTGKFTQDAIKEASRDGALSIDLINGDLLCDKLKEFNLGVKTELIEEVTINPEWFDKI